MNRRNYKPTIKSKILYKVRDSYSRYYSRIHRDELLEAKYSMILSPGRTGTRTLGFLINELTDVISRHEPRPTILDLAVMHTKVHKQQKYILDEFLVRRGLYLKKAYQNSQIFCESNYGLTYLADIIFENFENSKAVFVTRDPYDYLRSAYSKEHESEFNRHRLFDNRDNRNRINITLFDKYSHLEWNNMSRFEMLCWNYRLYHEKYLNLKDQGFNIPIYYFEKLFQDKHEQIKIIKDLGIKETETNLARSIFTEKRNTTKNFLLDEHYDWDKNKINTFKEILYPIIEKIGYEFKWS